MPSYCAFQQADGKTTTKMAGYLHERGFKTLYVTGLAPAFCVAWAAMDGRKDGFTVYVIDDACRAIDLKGSVDRACNDMQSAAVKRIQSDDILLPT